jgi:hypothetical protein
MKSTENDVKLNPYKMLCRYHVPIHNWEAFKHLLIAHRKLLQELEVVIELFQVQNVENPKGEIQCAEFIVWKSKESFETAKQDPRVLKVWEPMAKLCETLPSKPSMFFDAVKDVSHD